MARVRVLPAAEIEDGGRLPFALKELVRLRVAGLNDCER